MIGPRSERLKQLVLQVASDGQRGIETMRAHKLRSLLTMLGMIFGVAAVVSMMSIGAGAQQQVLAFIEQLGVRNLIVEAKEAASDDALQKIRRISVGLSERDLRVIESNVTGISRSSMRKRFVPQKLIPKPVREAPVVFGISPAYREIAALRVASGRFIDALDARTAAPVCVLGERARTALFGTRDPLGEHVKVNEQWFRVVGTIGAQVTMQGDLGGTPAQDQNNVIYVPVEAALLRLEDSTSRSKDEIDAVYLQLESASGIVEASDVVRGILASTHHGADDFSLVVPAQLLAEQRRTQRIFGFVMVALASISLLVGGIGIMNIMLASVAERTREVGIRRAVGASRRNILAQFLIEACLLTGAGGVLGGVLGIGFSELIQRLAGWPTALSGAMLLLSLLTALSTGVGFGLYPAWRAAQLEPMEALRHA
jgi:putative ABC transport system permease protein